MGGEELFSDLEVSCSATGRRFDAPGGTAADEGREAEVSDIDGDEAGSRDGADGAPSIAPVRGRSTTDAAASVAPHDPGVSFRCRPAGVHIPAERCPRICRLSATLRSFGTSCNGSSSGLATAPRPRRPSGSRACSKARTMSFSAFVVDFLARQHEPLPSPHARDFFCTSADRMMNDAEVASFPTDRNSLDAGALEAIAQRAAEIQREEARRFELQQLIEDQKKKEQEEMLERMMRRMAGMPEDVSKALAVGAPA